MTKAIRSYPPSERRKVIERRLRNPMGGLGTIAAQNAAKYYSKLQVNKEMKEEDENEVE